jgi:glycosyltransferase involved in cell wall biosynthesis
MRFCLVNRYFWPDESATSMLLTDLAEELASCGHEVHVLTSRQLYSQPRARLPAYQDWHGIKIHRLFSTSFGRRSFMGRLFDVVTFRWSVTSARHLPGPDAWFVMTDPPLILEQVLKLRQRMGGRIVHHVDDIYPDLAIALGVIPGNGVLQWWVTRRAFRAFLRCDQILALGGCMAEILQAKGVNPNQMDITPPWADGKKIVPIPRVENAFRRELGLRESDFVVIYSGNMGQGHRFETVLQAAKLLDQERNIEHIFIGDGAKRGEIEAYCRQHHFENFRLLPYQPRERLRETLSAGDIHLVSLDSRVQGLIVPSKLAGILAAGRPVIFIGDSANSVAQAILRGDCGFVITEGDVDQLMGLIRLLANDPEQCRTLGMNARRLFDKEYDRTVVVPKIISHLER